MKKMCAICAGALVSLSLLVSLPAFGGSGINVEDGKPAIVKVFGAPVGIKSLFRQGECYIHYGALPSYNEVAPGETLAIKVIGDKDIIVRCNGKKGITISRE